MGRVLETGMSSKRRQNSERSISSRVLQVASAGLFAIAMIVTASSDVAAGESSLVALSRIDPTIRQDIRYAGSGNFTGRPVPGYSNAECWLRAPVAHALAKVQADLARETPPLSLKVFDCYRPRRAVEAFAKWAEAADDGATRHYHPNVARGALLPLGYIGRTSTHSKGIAVDLTLVAQEGSGGSQSKHGGKTEHGRGASAPCTHSSDRTHDATSLDMGTAFDCFDPKSHTAAGGLTEEQKRARNLLKRVMQRHGFENYAKEWWHYTFSAADDGRTFDVPVGPAQSGM